MKNSRQSFVAIILWVSAILLFTRCETTAGSGGFGIRSRLVAHEVIQPSLEWQREIELALRSMQTLVPLISRQSVQEQRGRLMLLRFENLHDAYNQSDILNAMKLPNMPLPKLLPGELRKDYGKYR